ncbi:hypothetical protein [Gulosibacter faecalis]|jgi:hypothetical protein|uniref:Uncharacterized protein n=1 Tax=Gulosibacter faecalis TaxID=272240 RepID=A0ABW5UUU0_9MICO
MQQPGASGIVELTAATRPDEKEVALLGEAAGHRQTEPFEWLDLRFEEHAQPRRSENLTCELRGIGRECVLDRDRWETAAKALCRDAVEPARSHGVVAHEH